MTNVRSSRFVTEDDLFHRALQICSLVILATSVLHIRPVKVMSNASQEISMFVFCLCIVLDSVLEACKSAEEYFLGVGHKVGIQNASLVQLYNTGLSLLFYIPALVVSAVEFFPRTSPSGDGRLLAGDSQEEKLSYATTNVPIILLLAGVWTTKIYFALRVVLCFPKNGRHKEV